MYRNSYQRGMLTVFFSVGSKPLNIWDTHTQNGYITRFLDQDIKSMVLEIGGTNVSTTYMTCPKGNQVLGITMPFLVMIVKNLKKYFTFEVTILDETGTRRRFRVSNFQSSTQILPLCTVMPIGLSDGWNQIQFNLAEFTRRAYKKQFVEVQKLKINANIRLRRIYFTERLIPEDQLPPEYKLYFPLASKGAKERKVFGSDKENIQTAGQIEAPPVEEQKEEPKPEEVRGSKAENIISKTSIRSVKKTPSKSTVNIEEGVAPPGSKKPSVSSMSAKGISAVAVAVSAIAQLVENAAEQLSTPGEQVLEKVEEAESPEGQAESPEGQTESPEGPAESPEGPAESPSEAKAKPPAETIAETPTEAPKEASGEATPAESEPPAAELEPAPAE